MNDFDKAFNKANQAVHKVENQWHYKALTDFGFIPVDTEQVGFVRAYTYKHPNGHTISGHTGGHCDYFLDYDKKTTDNNYWSDLEPHLKNLKALHLI